MALDDGWPKVDSWVVGGRRLDASLRAGLKECGASLTPALPSIIGTVAMGSAREKSPGVEATVTYQMLDEKKVVVMGKGRKSMVRMRVVTVGSCRVVDEALVHSALARTTARFLVNFAPWSIYVSRRSATCIDVSRQCLDWYEW